MKIPRSQTRHRREKPLTPQRDAMLMPRGGKKAAKKSPAATASTRKKKTAQKTPKAAARKAGAATSSQKPKGQTTAALAFPVVGIGASAGGLEAISEMLKPLPDDIGMAFVLVQHLAPEHHSMMSELLSRETTLKVSEATDGIKLASNHIYVIPPDTNLGIINNTLQLIPRDKKTRHLPIDYFFHSLATDQGSNAIGIILSGSASDGTLGLKAIKTEGGITFAQTPESARYDSMPFSAIAAGCVDFVLSPRDIARELIHLARHPTALAADIASAQEEPTEISNDLDKIFLILRNRTGNDFAYYKHTTIRRRISRRMLVNKIDRLKDYVRYLSAHPAEVDALFQDILINVTGFFRDPEIFEALKTDIFPAILKDHDKERPLRIWVPGCSTGEEMYSILISLLEYLGDNVAGITIQAFASDIDQQAIEKARNGIYPEGITAQVSPERLQRFFTKVPQGFQVNKRIRDLCIFATQNITKDPPFSHQDLIACRNMLIYMGNMLQRKVLQTLHYALDPGGYLVLGSSETVGASADLFSMTGKEYKIYQKKDVPRSTHYHPAAMRTLPELMEPPGKPLERKDEPLSLQQLAESIILNQYAPPAVIVNERLDILQFIGNTGPYIQPSPGIASLNLVKLAHPDLLVELRTATHNAIRDNIEMRRERVRLRHNGTTQEVTIVVLPLPPLGGGDRHFLVMFQKAAEYPTPKAPAAKGKAGKQKAPGAEKGARVEELEQELAASKSYLQAIIEDQEAANEELQAANEEIQSTNEELQSTNEELETAKEELQSTNEELVTVNEELWNRNAELTIVNDDMKNIISSTELPVVMLNEALRIRFFSPQAHQLLNLIDSDIGRPIGDIRPNVETGDITEEVHQVIETLRPLSKEVHNNHDHWYSMRIRPYRTEDNHIKGAVIVFIDITDNKLGERTSRLATVVEDSNDAVTVQDFKGRIQAWNRRAAEIYGYTETEALDANVEMLIPEAGQAAWNKAVDRLLHGGKAESFEATRIAKNGKQLKVQITLSLLKDAKGKATAIATTERLL
jgi:two-component system CheB/CheR fusion protein